MKITEEIGRLLAEVMIRSVENGDVLLVDDDGKFKWQNVNARGGKRRGLGRTEGRFKL